MAEHQGQRAVHDCRQREDHRLFFANIAFERLAGDPALLNDSEM
jgi:hypothetical protein